MPIQTRIASFEKTQTHHVHCPLNRLVKPALHQDSQSGQQKTKAYHPPPHTLASRLVAACPFTLMTGFLSNTLTVHKHNMTKIMAENIVYVFQANTNLGKLVFPRKEIIVAAPSDRHCCTIETGWFCARIAAPLL